MNNQLGMEGVRDNVHTAAAICGVQSFKTNRLAESSFSSSTSTVVHFILLLIIIMFTFSQYPVEHFACKFWTLIQKEHLDIQVKN